MEINLRDAEIELGFVFPLRFLMDMTGNDTNVVPPKGTEETVHYHAPNMCLDWHVTGNNPMVESSSCSPMLNSFCPPIWDHPNITGTNWMPNGALREDMFLSSVPVPHFPAGSDSVGQAAGFSCFDGGHFSRIVNPFGVMDPLDHNSRLGLMQKPNEAMVVNELRASTREVSTENLTRPNNVVENGVDVLGAQSDHEAEFSGGREEFDGTGGDFFRKGIGLKKRKRTEQKTVNNENNEAQQPADEFKEKGDQNPSPMGNPGGKGSDPPKEEYIHVRARRGQATNSHSLAERIRREKISDRMKFLQDLVPGCSKLTGKAVMLDEIINYVQSLQRQVEFLSMKLATVNPRLDFNLLEGFLAKDILQTRAGLSSSLDFPPDMTMHFPRETPQAGLIHACLPRETLQRPSIHQSNVVSGGFREPTSRAPGVWDDDELHNVVHNGFNFTAPLNISDLSGHAKTNAEKESKLVCSPRPNPRLVKSPICHECSNAMPYLQVSGRQMQFRGF
ncbi:hypothetical protein OROMI_010062 [Orobanche minor]